MNILPIHRLPWDTRFSAIRAMAAGWRLDEDDWWRRPLRSGDIDIPTGNAHFGFTTDDLPEDNAVYVRSASYALAFDRGTVIPYEKGALDKPR